MKAIKNPIDRLEFTPPARVAFTSLGMLPMLKGKPFDDRALALIASLRPSSLGVIIDPERRQLDHVPWRVRVYLKDGLIDQIAQDVEVGLPERFSNFSELKASIKGTDEPKNTNH